MVEDALVFLPLLSLVGGVQAARACIDTEGAVSRSRVTVYSGELASKGESGDRWFLLVWRTGGEEGLAICTKRELGGTCSVSFYSAMISRQDEPMKWSAPLTGISTVTC